LSGEYKDIPFFSIDADKLDDLAEQYNVQSVPYTVVLKDGTVAETLEGAHPTKLVDLARKYATSKVDKSSEKKISKRKSPEKKADDSNGVKKLIQSHPVLLALIPSNAESKEGVGFFEEP